MPKGFYFDNARCTGCRTCVMACKDYHDHGADEGFRRVIDYEDGGWTVAEDGTLSQDAFAYHISLACNHCANPACAQVCPTEAMHRDELGLIWPDHSKCIGCGYCTMACPYHAPAIDKTLKRSSKCDGCRERIAAGLAPICVEACPLRALDFGEKGELHERHEDYWDEVRGDILPLPEESATGPNLFILPSPAAAENRSGSIANRKELNL